MPLEGVGLDGDGERVTARECTLEDETPIRLGLGLQRAQPFGHAPGRAPRRPIQLAAHHQLRTPPEQGLEPVALQVGPVLERGAPRNPEVHEEGAGVARHRLLECVAMHRVKEVIAIDGDRKGEDQLLGAGDRALAEQPAEVEERLAQGRPPPRRIEVGPAEIEQRLARRAAARRECEVDEHGERLAGAEDGRLGALDMEARAPEGLEAKGR